jgi:hypothetical protein
MKKILLILLVIPFFTFAQFPQTFEGTTFPPTGWTSFVGANGLGTVENWKRTQLESTNNTAYCVWEVVGTGQTAQDWLVTPQVAITAANKNLTFQSIDSGSQDYGSIYTVRVSTTSQTNITSFTTVDTQNETQIAHSQTTMVVPGSKRIIDLSAYIGQSIYVAFVLEQNDGDSWRIDNVNFEGCPIPVLTADTFTDNSAVINFDTSGNYQIEYGVYPFTQGSASGAMTESLTAGSTKTLTGLTPGVSYSVYARKDCGSGNFSAWSAVRVVGTSNSSQESVPYSSSFEGASNQVLLYNIGWTNPSTNVGSWGWFKDGSVAPFYSDSGVYNVGSAISTTTARNAYLYSKPIAMTGGQLYKITYKYRAFSSATTTIPMAFRVVTNTTNTSTGVNVLTTKTGINNITYISETLDFTPTTTGNYYIGFHNNTPAATGATSNNLIFIDTFSVTNNLSNDNFSTIDFSVYPNPANDVVNVSNSSNAIISTIEMTDLNGRVVKNVTLNATEGQINISDLSTGVYMMNVTSDQGSSIKKVVKN